MSEMKNFDAVIIGAGPAGLSAAVYLKRATLSTAIIEKMPFPGGQILNTDTVENYPGFNSISGFELSEKFRAHAAENGAEFITAEVERVEQGSVTLKNSDTVKAKVIIIATGSTHRKLGAKGENEFSGKGVSYCATCDGAFFKNKHVAVIGGGDTALEDALYLCNICEKVTLIHRRKELRAAKVLCDKFLSMPNAEFLPEEEVECFSGDTLLNEITLKSGKSLKVDGAFIAVGQIPQTDFLPDKIKDAQGYIITDELCRTPIKGIFAAGDVRAKECRQVVTAAADGAIVCSGVLKYLNGE